MKHQWTAEELIEFEKEVAARFTNNEIRSPAHLCGGNELQVIDIFKEVKPTDYVFSTWRSTYHALLHGVPRERVMADILAGKSMGLNYPEHKFFTSAIVGGILPIAVGVAAALHRRQDRRHVWCFIGDMAATIGVCYEAMRMSGSLPITFVVEDNGVSANTPTDECWPANVPFVSNVRTYKYERTYPHVGVGQWVKF